MMMMTTIEDRARLVWEDNAWRTMTADVLEVCMCCLFVLVEIPDFDAISQILVSLVSLVIL